jgi:hypothetical protein
MKNVTILIIGLVMLMGCNTPKVENCMNKCFSNDYFGDINECIERCLTRG